MYKKDTKIKFPYSHQNILAMLKVSNKKKIFIQGIIIKLFFNQIDKRTNILSTHLSVINNKCKDRYSIFT